MRSKDAPASVARINPAVATKESETIEATSVPTNDQPARVSSAPNRRYQRNPYTVAAALPPGRELVRACEANVILRSGAVGASRPPLLSSSYWRPAKQTNDSVSASTAVGTHHQLSVRKTSERPESSSRCEARTHSTRPATPKPSTSLTTGQIRRRI